MLVIARYLSFCTVSAAASGSLNVEPVEATNLKEAEPSVDEPSEEHVKVKELDMVTLLVAAPPCSNFTARPNQPI